MDPFTLAAIFMAISSVATAGYTIYNANQQQKWQEKQIDAQQSAEMAEYGREAEEQREQSVEEKSDLSREMEKALASARLASAEGFGAIDRSIFEIGDVYGTDLARMEANRVSRGEALHSGIKASQLNASMSRETSKFDASARKTSAVLGFLNSSANTYAGYKINTAKADK